MLQTLFTAVGKRNHHYRLLSSWRQSQLDPILSSELYAALDNPDKAIVALETAVVTHGMPWPANLELANELEAVIRREGAVPATIGVIEGRVKVGLSSVEMEALAKSVLDKNERKKRPRKVSRRDLFDVGSMQYGGTTVSGTIVVCAAVGLRIFATGGIGGVHRGVTDTSDVSADLRELGRNSVCVVCSGVKSILDIPRTLEVLETEGVFVSTFGSDTFPGFFQESSGQASPHRFDTIRQASQLVTNMEKIQIDSGILLAVPIPKIYSSDGDRIQAAIEEALHLAEKRQISGPKVTPFLLDKVNAITQGKSLDLNMKLLTNNAKVAAQIAVAKCQLQTQSHSSFQPTPPEIVVIGGSMVDLNYVIEDPSVVCIQSLTPRGTYDCQMTQGCGGVGRNIAETLGRLDQNHRLVSALGNDFSGEFLRRSSKTVNWSLSLVTDKCATSNCGVLHLQNKDILIHTGDMRCHKFLTKEYLQTILKEEVTDNAKLIISDLNIPIESLEYLLQFGQTAQIPICIEPTDVLLMPKLADLISKNWHLTNAINLITPNIFEFQKLMSALNIDIKCTNNSEDTLNQIKTIFFDHSIRKVVPNWLIKLGAAGVVFVSDKEIFMLKQSMFFVSDRSIANTSGAGDCMIGCIAYLRYGQNMSWIDSVVGSMRIVVESLSSQYAVPQTIETINYSPTEILKWKDRIIESKLLSIEY